MKFKEVFLKLLHSHNNPEEVALGVAVGVFIGMTPLYGFHVILMIIFALLIRKANKVAIFIGTNVSLPPTVPFITWAGYNVGRRILGNNYPDLSWTMFKGFTIKDFLHLYYPLFIGSLVLGFALATVVFFLLWGILWYRRKLKLARAAAGLIKFIMIPLAVSFIIFSGHCSATPNTTEEPVEKISYRVSPFGKAVYEDFGIIDEKGQKVRLATFTTHAMGFYDVEKIFSNIETLLPIRVERYVDWWRSQETLIEIYDQKDFTLLIEKFVKGEKVKEYRYQKDGPIHNAITLPFYLRAMPDLKIGWTFTARVPDEFHLKLISIEKIRVPLGRFETYHFVCDSADLEIWISTDSLRIPVKIKGKNGAGYIMYLTEHWIKQK